MDETTKVMLSAGELAIAENREIILTKRIVMERAAQLFSLQTAVITGCLSGFENLPEVNTAVPRIFKGENYNGYPYVIMDYPAVFAKDNIFALRSMFWWGNFFSITLHLSGKYKALFQEKVFSGLSKYNNEVFICTNEKEWEHHFEPDNYRLFTSLSEAEKTEAAAMPFIKIAVKYELHHWNMMQSILPEGYKKILDYLKAI